MSEGGSTVRLVTSKEVLERLLAVGNESASFEVKGQGSLKDKAYVAKIARAVMAMGNRRDGGVVCLGIDEPQMTAMAPGLDPAQAAEWADFDNVSAALAKYADPAVTFSLDQHVLSSGATIVVLEVEEFETVPHVCKRTFPGELQDGMTYVRSRGKPESVPVPNSAEMRALLDLATAKGVRDFVRVAGGAGVGLGVSKSQAELDEAEYAAERDEAWANPSPLVTELLTMGHTDVAVRPTAYSSGRVLPVDLLSFVSNNAVRLRGWPVPFVDSTPPARHGQWLGQDIDPDGLTDREAWRFWGSGQFLHRRVLVTERSESVELRASDPSATGAVAVWDVLLYMVEVAEFGARMATSLDVASISFDLALVGVAGRQLIAGERSRELGNRFLVAADRLEAKADVESTRLLSDTRQVGVELAQQFLQQFGASIPDKTLLDYQAGILTRGQ